MGNAIKTAALFNTEIIAVNMAVDTSFAQDLNFVSMTGALKLTINDDMFGNDIAVDIATLTDDQGFLNLDLTFD